MFYILLKAAFIAVAFWWLSVRVDSGHILSILENANIWWLSLALLANLASLFASSIRATKYLEYYNYRLTYYDSIKMYMEAAFYSVALPGSIGGDGYRVTLLKVIHKVPTLHAIRIILCERLNGLYILSVLGLLLFWVSDIARIEVLQYLSSLLLLAATPVYVMIAIYMLGDKPSAIIRTLPLSITTQMLQVLMFYLVLRSFGIGDVPMIVNFCVLSIVASIASIAPISFGGLGVREIIFFYGLGYIERSSYAEQGVAFGVLLALVPALSALAGMLVLYAVRAHRSRK